MNDQDKRLIRVLLIRFSSLGDVVLVSAVIEALRQHRPDAEVFLLTKAEYTSLYERDPRVAGVIPLNEGAGVRDLISLARTLKAMAFDVVIDLHANLRSHLLTDLLGKMDTIRYRKRHWTRWAMMHTRWLQTSVPHTVDAYLDALAPLGIRTQCKPLLYINPAATPAVDAFLDEQMIGPEDTLIGIQPGSKWPLKRWTIDGFATVAGTLMQKPGVKVVFLGDAADQAFVAQICSRLNHQPIIGTGRFDLKELVGIISRCALFLTNDSGPMHIASALGVSTVALFGPTHPMLGFAPRGKYDRVITVNAPCSPCSLHGGKSCRQGRRKCMEDISPEQVLETLEDLMKAEQSEPK